MKGPKEIPVDFPEDPFVIKIGGDRQPSLSLFFTEGKLQPSPTGQLHLRAKKESLVFLQVFDSPEIDHVINI
jgi:hypothetical protein